MKLKHYTDSNYRRSFKQRMIDRIYCNFPLSLYSKFTYPYFCILILNDKSIPYNAKLEFIENFIKPYMKNSQYFFEMGYSKICFCDDRYIGCLDDDQINEFLKQYIKENNLPENTNKKQIIRTMFENYNPATVGMDY